jgi:WD40 repeat protein
MTEITTIGILLGHNEDRVWHISWSQNGHYIASCGEDKIIKIWSFDLNNSSNLYSINCVSTLEDGQTRTIRSSEWSHNGNMIASASFDGTVFLWQTRDQYKRSWEKIATLEGHDNEVKSVAWSPEDNRLATCGRDKKIWLWEILSGGEFECVSVLEGHTQDIKFVLWHPSGLSIISCSYDDTIKIWMEEETGEDDWHCVQTLNHHKSTVWGLTIHGSGRFLISCSDDRSLILWECFNHMNQTNYKAVAVRTDTHNGPIYSVDLCNQLCVSVGGDNSLVLSNIDFSHHSITEICRVTQAHTADINCVRWNPSNQFSNILATCGDDSLVKIWKVDII